jgi:hypothetical protein
MRRFLKWAFAVLVVTVAIIAVLAYPMIKQGISFESYRSEMTKLIESAEPEDRALPQRIRDLLLFSLDGHTAPYAARLLIRQFDTEGSDRNPSTWNPIYASWSLLVALHFSEQDRLTIISRLAPTGGGRQGLSVTSQTLFKRPLSELSLAEAATLVVLVTNPPLYDKPDRLNEQRDQLLSRYRNGQV